MLAAPTARDGWTALKWCGTGETAEPRASTGSAQSADTIRVFYAFPTDVSDRFATLADAIVTDVAAIDQWWQGQDPLRDPRWTLNPNTGCSGIASLDLGALALKRDAAYYTASSGYERVVNEVVPHVRASEKALVFLDGFVIDPGICGVSEMAPRNGSTYGVSVVSLRSECWVDLGAGGLTARIAAHELVHNLGAVPSKAPNRCGNPGNGGHVCDNPNDLMFPYASGSMRLGAAVLDVSRDDYYAHAGEWWDVQDSAWLVHLPMRALQVVVSGPGSVSGSAAGIACPETCTAELESDVAVELTAHPTDGVEFYGWKGSCSGEKACVLRMTRDVSVLATFGSPRPTLLVRVEGKGRVTSAPAGVSCPGKCTAKYVPGQVVRLHAQPSVGWRLERWSSPCGAKPSCSLGLTTSRKLTVRFVRAGN